jgi:hypothetical protein
MDDKTKEDRPETEPKPNGQPAQAPAEGSDDVPPPDEGSPKA